VSERFWQVHHASLAVILLAGFVGSGTPSLSQEIPSDHLFAAALGASDYQLPASAREVWASDFDIPEPYLSFAAPTKKRAARLDMTALINGAARFLREYGIPLQEQLDPNSKKAIGVTAAFAFRHDLPAIRFQAGRTKVESFGAFYSERGFRGSIVLPMEHWSLRLEAGEDSALGYFGIIGAQWTHPRRPLSLGLGLPMNLRTAGGGVGVVIQLRLRLG
jgi:hypothetical protein